MEKSYTCIFGSAKPGDTAKREWEIEEGLLRKQEEAQKEPDPAKSDSDATGTSLEKKTGKNLERRRKASYQDDRKGDRIPERSSDDDKKKRLMKEGEVPIMILNQARKLPMKEMGHTMKISQGKRLPRGY